MYRVVCVPVDGLCMDVMDYAVMQRDRHTGRQTDIQAARQPDRRTNKQIDRNSE